MTQQKKIKKLKKTHTQRKRVKSRTILESDSGASTRFKGFVYVHMFRWYVMGHTVDEVDGVDGRHIVLHVAHLHVHIVVRRLRVT